MTAPSPKIALAIPVHNRRETTLKCLRNLARADKEGFEVRIFVVDDGSNDGTSEAIREEFPEVRIIQGDGTLHYAAGTNRGIEAALDWGADFVVTMNDDSIFHDQFLRRLYDTAKRNPRSIVGALLLLWDEPHRVFQIDPVWNTIKGGWQMPQDLTAFSVPHSPFEVECIVGNCVLFPINAIVEVGLMDEKQFPNGWGDAQYTVRMRKHGWRLLVEPTALAWCEPNTYPEPLHKRSFKESMGILFSDQRHPMNLKRQFIARWESAPSRTAAFAAFMVHNFQLGKKFLQYKFLRRSESPIR